MERSAPKTLNLMRRNNMTIPPDYTNQDSKVGQKSNINVYQAYEILAYLVMRSEWVRLVGFNTLLVVNSILILAWTTLSAGTSDFSAKPLLLTLLCAPGF